MPLAILIGVGAVALISGPICGGVQWHHWNRDHARNPWAYRHAEDAPREIPDKDESLTA
jgi:hypothetical protein